MVATPGLAVATGHRATVNVEPCISLKVILYINPDVSNKVNLSALWMFCVFLSRLLRYKCRVIAGTLLVIEDDITEKIIQLPFS